MKRIVLLSCIKKKANLKCKAKDLYQSNLFRKSYAYSQTLKPDKTFILSAKYGLVCLDQEIEPYEKTLNDANCEERREWTNNVAKQLSGLCDLQNDHFTILAGRKYIEYLISQLKHYELPLKGLRLGEQLSWLNQHI